MSRKTRRFVELIFSVKKFDATEFDEDHTTRGFVDANTIESFYEDDDGGTYIATEFDEFKVMNPIEEILRIVNAT